MTSCPRDTEQLDEILTEPSEPLRQLIATLPGRFAVLGAAGKMGFHVSRMLQRTLEDLGRPEPVLTVSRFGSLAARQKFAAAGFEVVTADLSREDEVAALPDADHVVLLAGIKFGTREDPDLLRQMNITLPRNVARRYRRSLCVVLSTGCVYSFSTPDSGGSTESDPTDPPGDYARSCLGREQAFVDAAENHGTRSAIIRLNYAIDLRYGVLLDIATRVFHGEPVSLETGFVNVIWQRDAVEHILRAFGCATAPPCVLNVTGAECLSVRTLAEEFGRRFGKTVTFQGREADTAWLSNAHRAHQLFGTPQMPVDRMLDWTAEWIRRGGPTLDKPTHFEVRHGDY